MKFIRVEFLTTKGEKAYKDIKAQPIKFREKMIVDRVFKEKVISENPYKVEIKVLIPHLALNLEIDNKIRETMAKKGCIEGVDYKVECEF